ESNPEAGERDRVHVCSRRADLQIARHRARLLRPSGSGKNACAQNLATRKWCQMQSVRLRQRLRVLALPRVGTRELEARLFEFRVHLQSLAVLLDRLRVIPLVEVRLADVADGDKRGWIQLQRPLEGVAPFLQMPGPHEHIA